MSKECWGLGQSEYHISQICRYLQKATTNKNLQNETASDCLGTNLPKSGSFRFAVIIA